MSVLDPAVEEFIPEEYKVFFNHLEDNIIESFTQSIVSVDKEQHPYVQFMYALERTSAVYNRPPEEVVFMQARVAFYAADYSFLAECFHKYNNSPYVKVFYARTLVFKNDFEHAEKLLAEVKTEVDFEQVDKVVNIYLFAEYIFTDSYIHYYRGDLERMKKNMETVDNFTGRYVVQKLLGEHDRTNLMLYSQIIGAMSALRSGNPDALTEITNFVDRWVSSATDRWLRGYYYNLSGISAIQNQEMEEGEKRMLMALDDLNEVHDLRSYSAVGANLGTLLILQGRREDGRKFIEEVIEPFIILGNYAIALTHMLNVSKLYLDATDRQTAESYLKWAESLTEKFEVVEPAAFSLFCYLYSKFMEFEKAEEYLNMLKEKVSDPYTHEIRKDADIYTLIWYYQAASHYSSARGNLQDAEEVLDEGISVADKNKLYDSSMELTFLLIQVLLKKYIVTGDTGMIQRAEQILDDLSPLIGSINNPYFNIIIFLIEGYLFAATNNQEGLGETMKIVRDARPHAFDSTRIEIEDFLERMELLRHPEEHTMSYNFLMKWMSGEQIKYFLVNEAIRLLNDLQFQEFELHLVEEELPSMLMIVQTNGITTYVHRFTEETTIDEHLVSALLMAMSSFSKEVFGEGILRKIEQEQHILLMDMLDDTNVIVLVVKEETYTVRKQFKKLVETLGMLNISAYIEEGIILQPGDPQYKVIEDVVMSVFADVVEEEKELVDGDSTGDSE